MYLLVEVMFLSINVVFQCFILNVKIMVDFFFSFAECELSLTKLDPQGSWPP